MREPGFEVRGDVLDLRHELRIVGSATCTTRSAARTLVHPLLETFRELLVLMIELGSGIVEPSYEVLIQPRARMPLDASISARTL